MSPSDMRYTVSDKIRELEREIGIRKHVYSNLIARGKLSRGAADRQIDILKAILDDYQRESSFDFGDKAGAT